MDKKPTLKDLYSFPGFRALARLKPHPYHPGAMVVTLKRRQKKLFVHAAKFIVYGMTTEPGLSVTLTAAVVLFIWNLTFAALNAQSARL